MTTDGDYTDCYRTLSRYEIIGELGEESPPPSPMNAKVNRTEWKLMFISIKLTQVYVMITHYFSTIVKPYFSLFPSLYSSPHLSVGINRRV